MELIIRISINILLSGLLINRKVTRQIGYLDEQNWSISEVLPFYWGTFLLFIVSSGAFKNNNTYWIILYDFAISLIYGIIVFIGIKITVINKGLKVNVIGTKNSDFYWIIITFTIQYVIINYYFIAKLFEKDLSRFFLLSGSVFFSNIFYPIVEECLILGLMFVPTCRIAGTPFGIVLISILRASAHFGYNFNQLLYNVIIFGIIGSFLYLKSKRLIAPILYHSWINFFITIRDWS